MLLTWVRDVYTSDDRAEMREAIEDIAAPLHPSGFASAGVYVFFDPDELSVLYIGLARDLSQRFAQHNSLVKMSATGCKRQQIQEWFSKHERLGYAVLLQSSFHQVGVSRQRGTPSAAFYDEESKVFWNYDTEGLELIRENEGYLIEAYVRRHGTRPPWNKVKGSVYGGSRVTGGSYGQLELAMGVHDSLLLARRSVRQLAAEFDSLQLEEALHLGRIEALQATDGTGVHTGIIWKSMQRLAEDPNYADTLVPAAFEEIVARQYHLLPPPPPGHEATPGTLGLLLRLTDGPPAPGMSRLRISFEAATDEDLASDAGL